jgi:hypothetical protein
VLREVTEFAFAHEHTSRKLRTPAHASIARSLSSNNTISFFCSVQVFEKSDADLEILIIAIECAVTTTTIFIVENLLILLLPYFNEKNEEIHIIGCVLIY